MAAPSSGPADVYTPRAPIYIDGDTNFSIANGVVGGAGTPGDPYVIEGWEIAAVGVSGIEIRDTRSHFIIRDVFVHGASFGRAGIWLGGVSNGTIENITASDNWAGIVVSQGANIVVSANNLSRNGDGIAIVNSRTVSIVRNRVSFNATGAGISVTMSEGFVVTGNDVANTRWGILVQWQSHGEVRRNDIRSTTGVGVRLYQASLSNVSVLHNRIDGNAIQAEDDAGPQNRWDEGYPSGGNFWSDYSGGDNCSGPQQDVCPDPDGIGDSPYVVDADSQDRYPLMTLPGMDQPPRPPMLLRATLAGADLSDVELSWTLSPDDRGGERDLWSYEVWTGVTYSANGSSYSRLDRVPRATVSYVHVGAGSGNHTTIFYQLVVTDLGGRVSRATPQAAKFARFMPAGDNLVSVPLEPSDWSLVSVLRTASWAWARTYLSDSGTWIANVRAKTWSEFRALNRTMAMWVNTSIDGWWAIAGLVPTSTIISLRTGWNLIGYPSFVPRTIGEVLTGVTFRQVEGFAPVPPYYLRRLDSSDRLAAGVGFWVWVFGPAVDIAVEN